MFATNNTERSKVNNLSSALLNRCITINLSPIDKPTNVSKVSENDPPQEVTAYDILCRQLINIQSSEHLVTILIKLHLYVISRINSLGLVSGYKYSFRNLLMSSNIISCIRENGISVVEALTLAVNRYYCGPLLTEKDKKNVLQKYFDLLQKEMDNLPLKHSYCISAIKPVHEESNIVSSFGNLASDVLHYFLNCLGKIEKFNYEVANVEIFLREVFSAIQNIFRSCFVDAKNIFNVDIELTYDNWREFKSNATASMFLH